MSEEFQARSVSESKTTLTELMIPAYSNFDGKIHGGILLSLMDKVAYICASRHSSAYCVTVAMDDVEFRQPVEVGDLVSLEASVHYVGNTSMTIGIIVTAESTFKKCLKHTNTSYVTMVAQGPDGSPRQIPPLLLTAVEEVQRYFAAVKRRESNIVLRENLRNLKPKFCLYEAMQQLKKHRCEIQLSSEKFVFN